MSSEPLSPPQTGPHQHHLDRVACLIRLCSRLCARAMPICKRLPVSCRRLWQVRCIPLRPWEEWCYLRLVYIYNKQQVMNALHRACERYGNTDSMFTVDRSAAGTVSRHGHRRQQMYERAARNRRLARQTLSDNRMSLLPDGISGRVENT